MSTQIIVQTDVVQAIFSHVLMVARAVRHVTLPEKDLTVPVIRVFKENIQGHPTSIFGKYLFGRRFEI